VAVEVRQYKDTKFFEYDIRFVLPDGRKVRERRKSPLTSRSAVQRWAEARERFLYLQATAPEAKEQKKAPTFNAFAPKYLAHSFTLRQKPSTRDGKKYNLGKWILPRYGHLRLDEFNNVRVAELKTELSSVGWSCGNGVLRALTNLLRVAIEFGELEAMPCTVKTFRRDSKEREYYGFAVYEQLLATASPEQTIMILLGAEAGLRAGEIAAVEWRDCDFDRGVLTIARAIWKGEIGLPKSNKIRRVPMSERLIRALKAYRHLRGPRVLYRENGLTHNRASLSDWLREAEAAAGLPVTGHVHALRHTFCSHLALVGTDVRTIMELAGHASIVTTQRYMHLAPLSTQNAISVLDQKRGEMRETGIANSVTG
jgi:integrase